MASGVKLQRTAQLGKLATASALGFAITWLGVLILMLGSHAWILDAHGKPIATDFVEVWVAGKTALAGQAGAVYDPKLHYAAEVAAVGHGFHGHLWWHYPPQALFLAAALALLPYLAAFLFWVGSTGAAYAAAVWSIAKSRLAPVVALGAPAVFLNAVCGQNGCLTATLMAAALVCLEDRPVLAGMSVGLLAYKPQLGLLFPFFLAASGRWRAFAVAGVVALLVVAAAVSAFGTTTLLAFIHYLPLASQTMLVDNHAGWSKLQSIYALARFADLTDSAARTLQAGATICAILGIVLLWRRDLAYLLKAAAVPVGCLLATPYLYMYDFPILGISIAFLCRHRELDAVELGGVAAANLIILAYALGVCVAPVGPIAAAVICGLVARRVRAESLATCPPLSAPASRTGKGFHIYG